MTSYKHLGTSYRQMADAHDQAAQDILNDPKGPIGKAIDELPADLRDQLKKILKDAETAEEAFDRLRVAQIHLGWKVNDAEGDLFGSGGGELTTSLGAANSAAHVDLDLLGEALKSVAAAMGYEMIADTYREIADHFDPRQK